MLHRKSTARSVWPCCGGGTEALRNLRSGGGEARARRKCCASRAVRGIGECPGWIDCLLARARTGDEGQGPLLDGPARFLPHAEPGGGRALAVEAPGCGAGVLEIHPQFGERFPAQELRLQFARGDTLT